MRLIQPSGIAAVANDKKIRWWKVLVLFGICVVVSFGTVFMRDKLSEIFPAEARWINYAIIILFAVLLVKFVMEPLLNEVGIPSIRRKGSSRNANNEEDHGQNKPNDAD